MEQEHTDAMETEQQNQEELQNQIEAMREKLRAAKKERDKADKQLEDYKANAESGSAELVATKVGIAEEKAKLEIEKMQKNYEEVVEKLKKDLVVARADHEEAVKDGESKLKASESMRMEVEAAHDELKEEKRGLTKQLTDMEGEIGKHKNAIGTLEGQVNEHRGMRVDSLAANLALKARLSKEPEVEKVVEVERRESVVDFNLQANEVESIDSIDERVQMKFEIDRMTKEIDDLKEKLEISKRANELVQLQISGDGEEKKDDMTGSAGGLVQTQLTHLMQLVEEHKLKEEQHKLELEKSAFEKSEAERWREEEAERRQVERQESEGHIRQLSDTLSQHKMRIEMFEEQVKASLENSDDPEAAQRAMVEARERQSAMEEKMKELLAKRDEGHEHERKLMEEIFKEKEAELEAKLLELEGARDLQRKGSVDIEKFAQLELELDRIPNLQADVERLQNEVSYLSDQVDTLKAENATMAQTVEQLSNELGQASAEGGSGEAVQRESSASGAVTMMLKAQLASLKQENSKLYKYKEDVDFIRLERDEMSVEVRSLKGTVKELEQTVSDMESAAVEKNAASALPNMMMQAKLRKEREAAQKQDAEQIRFLQDKLDKTTRQLLNMTSNVCDYVTNGEDILTKDGVDLEEVEVEETPSPNFSQLISVLEIGNGVEIIELSTLMEVEHDSQLILDYLDKRMRQGALTTRNELNSLREVRDNPPSSGGGGAPKLDFMAKQKEFRLNKKLKDAEAKLVKLKEESVAVKAGLTEKLERMSERSEKNEREYLRVSSINEQLIPQVKAWESLKVEHEGLQIKYNELLVELEILAKELESKKNDMKG